MSRIDGEIFELVHEIWLEKEDALKKLEQLGREKITFKRPVFFIPGWRDENNTCWCGKDKDGLSMQEWIQRHSHNSRDVYFINFVNESKNFKNFVDFGTALKKKMWILVGKDKKFDVVAHGAGGLYVRSLITQGDAIFNCYKCITVETPHAGVHLKGSDQFFMRGPGRFVIDLLGIFSSCQIEQRKRFAPNNALIQKINTPESRRLFIERIQKLYQLRSTKNFSHPGSGFMDQSGIEAAYNRKMEQVMIQGGEAKDIVGMAHDPRTVLVILKILLELYLP